MTRAPGTSRQLNHGPLLKSLGGMAPPQAPSSFGASPCQPVSPSCSLSTEMNRAGSLHSPTAWAFQQLGLQGHSVLTGSVSGINPFQVRSAGMAWAQFCFSSGKHQTVGMSRTQVGASRRGKGWALDVGVASPVAGDKLTGPPSAYKQVHLPAGMW